MKWNRILFHSRRDLFHSLLHNQGMEFPKLPNANKKELKNSIFYRKGLKRLLFMREAYERVNGACEFER